MNKIAAIASSIVVLLVVAAGLLISGSPGEQRLIRFDQQRINDLRSISAFIDFYWQRNERLPTELSELIDGTRVPAIPSDPMTGLPYDFLTDGQRDYQLCAVFSRQAGENPRQIFWHHPAGRHCFSFVAATDGRNQLIPFPPR